VPRTRETGVHAVRAWHSRRMLNPFLRYLRRHHIALIALFVALGGSAYAASQINSGDVRNGSLRGADVKNESLTGRDIKNGSVSAGDLAENAGPGTVTVSAIVDDFINLQLDNPYGISGVSQPGTGLYSVTLEDGINASDCNFVTTPVGEAGPSTVAAITPATNDQQSVTFEVVGTDGNATDITPAGWYGFSIVGVCPAP